MKKVLVIDDDAGLRTELIQVLGFEGYEALAAENGREGILLAQKHRPHLIICDLTMPVLNGFGVITELREVPETADIPVVLLSGQKEQIAISHGLQLGAVVYLTKPCTLDEFLAAVRSQIDD